MTLRVGTRSSQLARAQTATVVDVLDEHGHAAEIVTITSEGDRTRSIPIHRLGVAGAFTAALEHALLAEEIDLAVHSLKDLPLAAPPGLQLAALLPRGDPRDALIVRPEAWDPDRQPPLVDGARVATSGPRRQSQLLAANERLVPVNVRGNVDTRLGKLREGRFDALLMAHVALQRAGLDTGGLHVQPLPSGRFPCAPGQAAIAVQARSGTKAAEAAARLDDPSTRTAVETERSVLGTLGGGCGLPLGAHLSPAGDAWRLSASFAGHAWDPAKAPRVDRVQLEAEDPQRLAVAAAERFGDTQARPRRPPLEATARPDDAEGPTVLVVASEPTSRGWAAQLRRRGLDAVPVPTRTFDPAEAPTGAQREALLDVDWIVATSRQAADPVAALVGEEPPDVQVGAVGPATARALQGAGLPAHLVAPDRTAEGLAEEIVRLGREDDGVLLALGDHARDDAAYVLTEAGRRVERWTAYRTRSLPVEPDAIDAALPADAALVMSPRNADALDLGAPGRWARRYLAVGPTTGKALRERGLDPITLDAPRPDAVEEILR